jgi:probable rRNA maturation factor
MEGRSFWKDLSSRCVERVFFSANWCKTSSVDFTFTRDEVIKKMNMKYNGKNCATNVLSFPLLNFSAPTITTDVVTDVLGDVVLSFETVLEESKRFSKPFLDHTIHLMTHGVLHLLGFDHEKEDDAAIMEALEVEVLSHFGVAAPYANVKKRGKTQILV